jgi:hypothetical protein
LPATSAPPPATSQTKLGIWFRRSGNNRSVVFPIVRGISRGRLELSLLSPHWFCNPTLHVCHYALPFCHYSLYVSALSFLSSRAKRRDLQFCGPCLEMFFKRSGEICGSSFLLSRRLQGPTNTSHFARRLTGRLCLRRANNLYPERVPDKQKFLP